MCVCNWFPELFITICQRSLQMAESLQKCRVGLSLLGMLLSTLIYGFTFQFCLGSLRCRISDWLKLQHKGPERSSAAAATVGINALSKGYRQTKLSTQQAAHRFQYIHIKRITGS